MRKNSVDIWTEPLPEAFRWDPTKPVAGTTKTYVRIAEELARRGHNVAVRYEGPSRVLNGVHYLSRDGGRVADIHIDINAIGPVVKGRKRLHQTSLYAHRDFLEAGYDHVFLLSDYHASTVLRGVDRPDVSILPLGCDYPTVVDTDLTQRGKFCCYTSAPERGMPLLEQIWPEVLAKTGYGLLTTPYSSEVADIAGIYDRSRFWLHPATGVELYCISALEAQAKGCIPFVVPHMALAETVRYGHRTDLFKFKDDLIIVLLRSANADYFENMRQERARELLFKPLPSWSTVVDQLVSHF